METLTSAPYNYVQGNTVVAKILAANIIGESKYSMENNLGGSIEIVPFAPLIAPYRGDLTSVG